MSLQCKILREIRHFSSSVVLDLRGFVEALAEAQSRIQAQWTSKEETFSGETEYGLDGDGSQRTPSDWTVQEVITWMQSRGWDEDICKRFAEHDITGDVLLELDTILFRDEVGLRVIGKRMRLALAITELRRPSPIDASSPPLRYISLPHPQHVTPSFPTSIQGAETESVASAWLPGYSDSVSTLEADSPLIDHTGVSIEYPPENEEREHETGTTSGKPEHGVASDRALFRVVDQVAMVTEISP
ncbi:hypothetical protein FA95DRAFT_1609350 [Auriscalpium vulgare]|uniref:Uncharacterized protein n=1 Tax=Auriscalpium vulgare TaxID=40419 RepID=A0ACB8RH99_9AGAM|nr:hypothetical protein FA95DRAFT_1609350 [Auriscalpium vulgare]